MQTLYTIGYTKKGLKDFVRLLREAEVDCVIDIRLNNTSQLAGFSKRDDLDFLLREGFGIDYTHMIDLAPSPDILEAYKATKNWPVYQARYRQLIQDRNMVSNILKTIDRHCWQRPCLLCAEPEPAHCHRRLLAEAAAEEREGLEIVHL